MSRVADARRLLERAASAYAPAAFSSSLGAEDMVLTDLVVRDGLPIEIFTLDTGRLHAETVDLIARVQAHYGIALHVVHPEAAAVADYVVRHGRDAFYDSRELRQRCCEMRKVEPLRRALAGKRAWITGLRRAQSSARAELPLAGFDAAFNIAKFNPLADWIYDTPYASLSVDDVPRNLKDMWRDTFASYSLACYEACRHILTIFGGNQRFQRADGAMPEKMRVIPNGVDVERFAAIRRVPGPRRPTIALIGRVVPIKDVKTFIRAAGLLQQQVVDTITELLDTPSKAIALERGRRLSSTFEPPEREPRERRRPEPVRAVPAR